MPKKKKKVFMKRLNFVMLFSNEIQWKAGTCLGRCLPGPRMGAHLLPGGGVLKEEIWGV